MKGAKMERLLVATEGLVTLTDAATQLGVSRMVLCRRVRGKRVQFSRLGNTHYVSAQDVGRLRRRGTRAKAQGMLSLNN